LYLKENGNPGLIDGYTWAAFLHFLVNIVQNAWWALKTK
jgi:hypothetical protein